MANSSPGREICPYCKKQFKRLKSHLPHCKMAGGPDSNEVLFPSVKVCSSVMPELLKTEKKGKIEGRETSPQKDNKKSKPDLTRNRTIKPLEELEIAGTAQSSNLHASDAAQTQIKHITEKTHKTKGSGQRASEEEVHAKPAKKVVSEMTLEKKSSKIRKSSGEMTSEGKEGMPHLAIEPPIQSTKPSSEPLSQTTQPFAKHKLSKGDVGKQNESSWLDSSTEDLQPIPEGITDRIDLVIENHRVRVLRKKPKSSIQNISLNGAAISNSKTSRCPIKSSPGEKFDSADGQQVVKITQSGGGKTALGLDLAGNIRSGKMEDGITSVKAHTLADCSVGSYRKVSSVPLQLAAGVKDITDKNPLFWKIEEGYPKGSHVYTSPKSEIYVEFAEALGEKDYDKMLNCSLTSLEKGAPLPSSTIVTSEISLRPPSLHMIESTSAHGLLAPDRSEEPCSLGLEFFPELYPNYLSLGLLSSRLPQWSVRIPGTQALILPSEGKHVPLAERCLMDVKRQDLPAWLAMRDLSPQGMLRVTRRAWNGYYNKYINVKKGGMAGISMLLLGYCVLSYAWSYEHIKQSRWQKYH